MSLKILKGKVFRHKTPVSNWWFKIRLFEQQVWSLYIHIFVKKITNNPFFISLFKNKCLHPKYLHELSQRRIHYVRA